MLKLEGWHLEIIESIKNLAKPKLINWSDELISYIRSISSQVLSNNSSFEPVSIDFGSDISPDYETKEFELHNYLEIKEHTEIIYSECLSHHGITWRLKVYPNGNGQAKGNYLSVFLEMVKGYSISAKYDYKIEMENSANFENRISREYTSDFEVGEWWGYNRFYKIEWIMNEGFILDSGSLKLKFHVKASSYSQECSDQSKYIEELESKVKGLKLILNEHNIAFIDESDRQEWEEDDNDKQPTNELREDRNDSSDDEGKEIEEKLIKNLIISEDQKEDHDWIQEDSFKLEEGNHLNISQNEVEKNLDYDNHSNESGEIENQIEDFRGMLQQEKGVNCTLLRELNRLGIDFSPNKINHNQEIDKDDNFIKEMNDTEQQFKMLEIYNKSFNKDMSARYGIYDLNSEENEAPIDVEDSDSTEGYLSREEFKDSNKFELLQVSPDSPVDSSRNSKTKDKQETVEISNECLTNQQIIEIKDLVSFKTLIRK